MGDHSYHEKNYCNLSRHLFQLQMVTLKSAEEFAQSSLNEVNAWSVPSFQRP